MSASEKLKTLVAKNRAALMAATPEKYPTAHLLGLTILQAEQIIAVVEAAEKAASGQRTALAVIKSNGFVFDSIGKQPGNWQHLAFTLYTDLCEIEAFANPALTALDEALS